MADMAPSVSEFLQDNKPQPSLDEFLEQNKPVNVDSKFHIYGTSMLGDIVHVMNNWPDSLPARFSSALSAGAQDFDAALKQYKSFVPPSVKEDMAKNNNLSIFNQDTQSFYKNWSHFISDSAWDYLDKATKVGSAAMAGVGGAQAELVGEWSTDPGLWMSLGPIGEEISAIYGPYRGLTKFSPDALGTNVRIPPVFKDAKANGLVGEAKTPEEIASKNAAVAETEPNITSDIHTVARQIAPKEFTEYDALIKRRDQITDEIDKLQTTKPVTGVPQSTALAERINQLHNQEPTEEPQVGQPSTNLAEGINQRFNQESILSSLQKEFTSVNQRLRELSTPISESYRKADAQIQYDQTVSRARKVKNLPPESKPIAEDVSKKLQAIGRSKEEADHGGALWQAFFDTLSNRLKGAEGNSWEMYQKHAADIEAGRGGKTSGRVYSQSTYHASHAGFDEFNDTFMGTGEGAQMYGLGHYVGDARGLGEHYHEEAKKRSPTGKAYLYTVDVPEHEEFLSREELLSKQSPQVQEKLIKAGLWDGKEDITGAQLYTKLARDNFQVGGYQNSRVIASRKLMEAGLPGMSYSDMISRLSAAQAEADIPDLEEHIKAAELAVKVAEERNLDGLDYRKKTLRELQHKLETYKKVASGNKSSNYVVFSPKDLKITNKEYYQDEKGPVFYSALSKGIDELNQAKASPDQWISTIHNLKGVKKEELEQTGVEAWLKTQKGSVPKEDVQEFLRDNQLNLHEVERGNQEDKVKIQNLLDRKEVLKLTVNDILSKIDFLGFETASDARAGLVESGPDNFDKQWDLHELSPEDREKLKEYVTVTKEVAHLKGELKEVKYNSPNLRLPGGKDYRELQLTLPSKLTPEENARFNDLNQRLEMSDEDQDEYTRLYKKRDNLGEFKSSHWDEPNVLSHVRFDTRFGSNGEKILHVAEIQSDWHQKGHAEGYATNEIRTTNDIAANLVKKAKELNITFPEYVDSGTISELEKNGYTPNEANEVIHQLEEGGIILPLKGIPDAPFKNTWHALTMKRMLRYAADHDYDKITWDTGKTQAVRNNLSYVIDTLTVHKDTNGKFILDGRKNDEDVYTTTPLEAKQLANNIGKDLAVKIAKDFQDNPTSIKQEYKGLDLEAGGEFHKELYDVKIPSFLKQYTKQWGGKVEDTNIPVSKDAEIEVHSLALTDEMKDAVQQGQPLFQGGKSIRGSLTVRPSKNLLRLFKSANHSTFIHESGHEFYELLKKFASKDNAPDDLKKDFDSVNNWLKIKEGKDITKAQHEKFARGFERYLMEGVAPSADLASTFARFRQWLTDIYKSVQALKAPINDEIRDVFDRLLSTNPRRTVIDPLEASRKPVESDIDNSGMKTALPPDRTVRPSEGQTERRRYVDIDKEGNIRLKDIHDISSNEEFFEAARQIIEANDGFIAARRGKVTYEDIIGGAEQLASFPPQQVIDNLHNFLVGSQYSLAQKMKFVLDFVPKVFENLIEEAANSPTDNPTMEYVAARQLATKTLETLSGGTADWSATGKAFQLAYKEAQEAQQLTTFLQDTLGMTYEQVKAEAQRVKKRKAEGASTGDIVKEIKLSNKAGDMLLEYLRNSWISGWATHIMYTEGNKIWSIYQNLIIPYLRGKINTVISKIAESKGKVPERAYPEEAMEFFHNFMSGQAEGLEALGRAFMMGQTQGFSLLGLARDKVDYEIENNLLKPEDRDARIDELVKNPTEAMKLMNRPPQNILIGHKVIPGSVGTALRIPGERMVGPLHTWDYIFNVHTILPQLIYRQVRSEGFDPLTDEFARRTAELKYEPPLFLVDKARKQALEQTLMSRSKGFAGALAGMANIRIAGFRPLAIFGLPFVQVSAQNFYLGIRDLTPLGLFTEKVWTDIAGKNGEVAQSDAIAKMTIGGALVGTVFMLRAMNHLSGSSTYDKKKAAVNLALYGQPNSFVMNGNGISLSRLGPLGVAISTINDFYDPSMLTMKALTEPGLDEKTTKDRASKLGQALMSLAYSLGDTFLDEGPVSGLNKMLEAIRDPARKGKQYVEDFVASTIPFSSFLRQTAHEIDPYQRERDGIVEDIIASIPFASETLSPRIDLFGNRIPNDEFEGAYVKQLENNPVIIALTSVYEQTGYFPAPVPRYINKIRLNEEQQTAFATYTGQKLYEMLNKRINMPDWNNLSTNSKLNIIKMDVKLAHSFGESLVQARDHSIFQQKIDQMKATIQGN